MTTWCSQIRAALRAGPSDLATADVADHLAHCAGCARFAERLESFREALRDHEAGADADEAYVARLRARRRVAPILLLGNAARRLLPIALAVVLALVLALAGPFRIDPERAQIRAEAAPDADPIAWLLDDTEHTP